ncbi:MAG: DinB family protein [Planctomycetota bacterium]|jgi:uncharacterized damage-inducible protein DinB
MDLLDRLLGHDAWTTRELLQRCRRLTDEELDREFDIGHRSLRRTFQHIIRNMEVWTDLISGECVPPDSDANSCRSIHELIERLERVTPRLERIARKIVDEHRLDNLWLDELDDPPQEKSYGGALVHVVTHSMHHRAQVLYLMRRLGVTDLIEGDALSWEAQHVPAREG